MRSCDDEFIKKVFIKIEMILCMRDRILRGVRFDVMKFSSFDSERREASLRNLYFFKVWLFFPFNMRFHSYNLSNLLICLEHGMYAFW